MKNILLLSLLIIASCTLVEEEEMGPQLPDTVSQWAIDADASSAYGGMLSQEPDTQTPYAATGTPDVNECRDSKRAWTPKFEDQGTQWLELTYDDELYVSRIAIHENFGPGAVTKVELLTNGNYQTFWEGRDRNDECPGVFEISYREIIRNTTFQMTPYVTDTVRIWLDTDVEGWNEIDAVQLIGYDFRWTVDNQTVVRY